MREYGHCVEVKSLEPYIKYCIQNGYTLHGKMRQTRMIYKRPDRTLGRITINNFQDGRVLMQLDFKEDVLAYGLPESSISAKLEINNISAAENILKFLGYHKRETIIRMRTVYRKGNVSFELDEFEEPKRMCVLTLEGSREEARAVYKELVSLIGL
jgi:adenylate cyclase class IV